MMRVLHVIEAMHQGGAEAMVVEHVRHAGADVESLVATLHGGGAALEAAVAAGATAITLDPSPGPGGYLATVFGLARLVREKGIAIVNGHDPRSALLATLAAVRAGVPVVRTEQSVHFHQRHSPVHPVFESLATAATSRVICTCEAVRASHASRFGWAAARFVTIPNGISARRASRPRNETRAALGLLESDRLILSVGGLTRQKAHSVLVEAFQRVARRMSAARLAIAGEGPLRRALELQVADAGLGDRVRLLGARPDVPDLIAAADVFVLTSVREGLPIALLEAMRGGCPVVATGVGGIPEAVLHGVSGWVVEPRNPGRTAEALLELLGDPIRAAALAREARSCWSERFTAERMVAETEVLYRDVLAGRGKTRDAATTIGASARERAS